MAGSARSFEVGGLLERLGLWPLRLAWFALPFVIGPALSTGFERFDAPGPLLAEGMLWAAWFAGLVASGAPSAVSLTAIRILAPGAAGLALTANVATGDWTAAAIAALGYGMVVTAIAMLSVVGNAMVNGSAYGSERRMTLRPPGYTLLGPIQLAWLAIFAGLTVGPILMLSGRYVLGVLALALGAGALWAGWRALHQLSRRWIVFVPAGFVLHDHLLAVEAILMKRATVMALGPAPTELDEETIDLSGAAHGLALQVSLREAVTFGRRSGSEVKNLSCDRIVFTPTLPGALLAEARTRAIAIGVIDAAN